MTPTLDRTSYSTLTSLIAQLALAAMMPGVAKAQTYYVDDDAPAGGDGRSWETAFRDLQDALDATKNIPGGYGDPWVRVNVAQGLYVPARGTLDRSASFRVPYSEITSAMTLQLRGGFAGIGAHDPNEYNPSAFVSVISADLRGDDQPGFINRRDNARQLLDTGITLYVSVWGFTLRGANAVDDPTIGGLAWNTRWANEARVPHMTLLYCRFEDNQAALGAAVVRCNSGGVTLSGCTFRGNTAGAVFAGDALSAYSCQIEQNSAGALWCGGEQLHLDRCSVQSNGGWFPDGPTLYSTNDINIRQSLIAGNFSDGSTIRGVGRTFLYNSTLAWNSSAAEVALIQSDLGVILGGNVLWGNSIGAFGNLGTSSRGLVYVYHSDVEHGQAAIDRRGGQIVWGRGNLDADPGFVDPDGPDDNFFTAEDNNFNLANGSVCIDAGDPNACCQWTDVEGKTAPVDGDTDGLIRADMGALENQGRPCVADVNHDGVVDGEDLWDFWRHYAYGDVSFGYADLNHDGFITGDDWDAFIIAYEGGC